MSPVKKYFLIAFGTLNLGLGMLGAILPLMPTTVFLLIAAACYVRSSERLYKWLINNKKFGPMILNYREHRAMSRSAKRKALLMLWVTLILSGLLVGSSLVWAILGAVGAGVSTIILSTRTMEKVLSGEEFHFENVHFVIDEKTQEEALTH